MRSAMKWRPCPKREPSAKGWTEEMYPQYVRTPEERRRWRLADAVARLVYEGTGEAMIWMATRTIYRSGIPT